MKSIKTKKSESILVRISPNDKALIERAAGHIGLSTSSFIVNASKRHAEAMLSMSSPSVNLIDSIASGLNAASSNRLEEIIAILKGVNSIVGQKK